MKSKSLDVSSVLTAIGTMPALIAPRNTAGKSMVSSKHSSTRASILSPRSAQRVGAPIRALSEIGEGVTAALVDVGDLVRTRGEVALEQIFGSVVLILRAGLRVHLSLRICSAIVHPTGSIPDARFRMDRRRYVITIVAPHPAIGSSDRMRNFEGMRMMAI